LTYIILGIKLSFVMRMWRN